MALSLPHIDDLDPASDAFTSEGTTHIDFYCSALNNRADSTIRISPLSEANGWLCERCIDCAPRLGYRSVDGVVEYRSTGEAPAGPAGSGRPSAKPATDKQMSYIASLASKLGMDDISTLMDENGKLTTKTASALITLLKNDIANGKAVVAPAASSKPRSGLDLTTLVSGTYAVPNGDTRLKVKIDVVTKGKWDGWVFVKDAAEYGNGSRYGSQKPGGSYRGKIEAELALILADPKAAMAAYGKLTSKCGVCNRTLEDADSIARGIGPVCASKF